MRRSLYYLLLCLLCLLCRLLCGLVLYLLSGLCTELSSFKVKAMLANVNTTASALSLLDQQCQPLPVLTLPL
jgi:hypothetical protein